MTDRPHRAPRVTASLLAILVLAGIAGGATGAVYHSRESALQLAFGAEAAVESQEIFLSADAQAEASRRAGSPVESRLVQRYAGRAEGRLLGHAYFETHQVRTLPETLMVVVAPDGTVAAVHVLAFHEPTAYLPHAGFLQQFEAARLDEELSLRTGIQGIAGSTFTATAVTAAVRRVLAIHAAAAAPAAGGR